VAPHLFLLGFFHVFVASRFCRGAIDMSCIKFRDVGNVIALSLVLVTQATAQLVWNQQMDEYSAILPLTLDNDVIRVRAKPPKDVAPAEITCDIGVTGTVLTDQRGTSANEQGEKVLGGLRHADDIDVFFTDRVFSGDRDWVGNRVIDGYDFDCGINIQYENKKKVAQLEMRVGYILPSGDIEGLTWAKLNRKRRQYALNIAKCERYRRDIANLQSDYSSLSSAAAENAVQQTRVNARMAGISRQIGRLERYVSREDSFRRDLAAFIRIEEYLKTKLNGTQVYVHFQHNGDTLPVDIDELKRSRIRPIQVFEPSKDPIKNAAITSN
jgi:hypothetical protein